MFIYFTSEQLNDKKFNQAIPQSEIISPIFMFFFLGILYSQIFASSFNHFSNRNKSYLNLKDKINKDQSDETKNQSNESTDEKINQEKEASKLSGLEESNQIKTNSQKFSKYNKSVLSFNKCSSRTRSTISKPNKYELNKQRKRYLTATNDSLATIKFSNIKREQSLVTSKSEDHLLIGNNLEKNKLDKQLKDELKNKELNEQTVSSHNSSSLNQEEDEINNLRIKFDQNFQDDNSTSGEDCSPYSSISSSTNLKLILNKHNEDNEIKLDQLNETGNFFEESIYQPKAKTKYYYFKEIENSNEKSTYTYDEKQTHLKRASIKMNETSERRNYSSSNDSENGSISPTTPTRLNDWPMINSENSSEDSENEEVLINDVDEEKIEQTTMPKPTIQIKENGIIKDDVTETTQKRLNSFSNKSVFADENDLLNKTDSFDKISCTIFQNSEWQKINLSMIDISSMIIKKVETVRYSNEYFYFAILFSLLFAFIPQIFRFQQMCTNLNTTDFLTQSNGISLNNLVADKELMNCNQDELDILEKYGLRKNVSDECRILKNKNEDKSVLSKLNKSAFVCGVINTSNSSTEEWPILIFELLIDVFKNSIYSFPLKFIIFVALIERFALSLLFFILLCVAERTYREVV